MYMKSSEPTELKDYKRNRLLCNKFNKNVDEKDCENVYVRLWRKGRFSVGKIKGQRVGEGTDKFWGGEGYWWIVGRRKGWGIMHGLMNFRGYSVTRQ